MTTVAREEARTVADRSYGAGLTLALVSASFFGLSGSLARSLLDLGWSPAAVVATRVGGAFLILLIPCLALLRRIGLPTRGQSLRMLAYGVVAIASFSLIYRNLRADATLQAGVDRGDSESLALTPDRTGP